MEIRPVGTVHSPVSDPDSMPFEGVPARVEVFPEYEDGLKGIESGSHITVMGWFHLSKRGVLRVAKTRSGNGEPRGVFGLRSSHRPNPISCNVCKLVRVEGRELHLERLDLVDGTPVVDIKRYSPSWDCVFAARSSRDLRLVNWAERQQVLEGMLVEAVNFHGETCVGAALGVRIVAHAMEEWGVPQKDPAVVAHMAEDGCIADAVQALTGVTLGNGRMKVPSGRAFRLSYADRKVLAFQPRDLPEGLQAAGVLEAPIDDLFAIRSDVYAGGEGPHGGKVPRQAPPAERQAPLLKKVRESATEQRLACAVAHLIAEELGVGVPDVGWAADHERVRIVKCQLGCFR